MIQLKCPALLYSKELVLSVYLISFSILEVLPETYGTEKRYSILIWHKFPKLIADRDNPYFQPPN